MSSVTFESGSWSYVAKNGVAVTSAVAPVDETPVPVYLVWYVWVRACQIAKAFKPSA